MDVVKIGDRPVGAGAPVYIIAEAGSNHDRDMDQARRLIDVAAEAGADAVKFQTFRADAIVAETPTRAQYLDGILPPGQTMSELFAQLELPREWLEPLAAHDGARPRLPVDPVRSRSRRPARRARCQGVQGRDIRAVAPAAHP